MRLSKSRVQFNTRSHYGPGIDIATWGLGGLFGSARHRKNLMTLYKSVPWLYRAVEARASAMASIPVVMIDTSTKGDGEEVQPEDVPLIGGVEWHRLINKVEAWLALYGCAYVRPEQKTEIVPGQFSRLGFDLSVWHPANVETIYHLSTERVVSFNRLIDDPKEARRPYNIDEVVYIPLPSREFEHRPGYPPAAAALVAAGVLNSIDDFNTLFFDRGALFSTVAAVAGDPFPSDLQNLEDRINEVYGGMNNAHRIPAVNADKVKFERLSSTLEEMAMKELTDGNREAVATAMGIPQSLLFSSASTFATARQDDKHFVEKTIIPDMRLIEEALNRQFFGNLGWRIKFKTESIDAFSDVRMENTQRGVLLKNAGIITLNETRALAGFDPVEDDSELLLGPQPAQLPASTDDEEAEEGMEEGIASASFPVADDIIQEVQVRTMADELKDWKRKVIKGMRKGTRPGDVEWIPSLIPIDEWCLISDALEMSSGFESVHSIFKHEIGRAKSGKAARQIQA